MLGSALGAMVSYSTCTLYNTQYSPDIENSGKTFKRIINHTPHIVKLISYLFLDQGTIFNLQESEQNDILYKCAISKIVNS